MTRRLLWPLFHVLLLGAWLLSDMLKNNIQEAVLSACGSRK